MRIKSALHSLTVLKSDVNELRSIGTTSATFEVDGLTANENDYK